MKGFSEKQIYSYQNSTKRLNFWIGAVRSGKTFISIIRFIKAMMHGPEGNAMIVGVSRESIQRNILIELCQFLGISTPTPKTPQINVLNRNIFLVGANDERAQRKIQGVTLALAYVDEVTLLPEGFFKMLLSRLSIDNAQLFGSSNPDSPFHWFREEFLNNKELDLASFNFALLDNPNLSDAYIKNLKSEYSGLWYKRYIEGQWVLAEGVVYDFFDEELHLINVPPGIAEYYIVGVDYGTKNPTSFVMIGYSERTFPRMWLEKEYYYDSQKAQRQKTDSDYAEDMQDFIKGRNIRCIYIDPSAASLKLEMRSNGMSAIYEANNDVLNGIRFVSKLISNGTFKICSNNKHTIKEVQTYRWDEKASEKGEDKPLKENDHAMDAIRYALYSHFGEKFAEDYNAKDIDRMWNNALGIQQELPSFFRDDHKLFSYR